MSYRDTIRADKQLDQDYEGAVVRKISVAEHGMGYEVVFTDGRKIAFHSCSCCDGTWADET